MTTWKIVPIGKAVLMLHPDAATPDQYQQAREMANKLMDITGIPWICIFQADLVDGDTVKEIAERFYGLKR